MTWSEQALEHARKLRAARDGIVSGQPIESGFIAHRTVRSVAVWTSAGDSWQESAQDRRVDRRSPSWRGPTHGRLARTVLEARNLKMHTGAVTEQGQRSTLLLMERLEEALMKSAGGIDGLTADDVMASPVAIAHGRLTRSTMCV